MGYSMAKLNRLELINQSKGKQVPLSKLDKGNIQFRIELNIRQRSRTEWKTEHLKIAEERNTHMHTEY
jgi:hypothetical protein